MFDLRGCPACGYARASFDDAAGTSQGGRSVESQSVEIDATGNDLGVNLIEVYCDNNASASGHARKSRDDWERLLADVGAGKYRLIILWDASRGSRELLDWIGFLGLLRDQRMLVHLITHGRTYDPANSRDWKILVQEGVEAHSQADVISENVKRGNKRARQKGRPHGHPPFGWRRVYDPASGKMETQKPVEEQQAQLLDMFTLLVSGEKPTRIAIEMNRRILHPEEGEQGYRTAFGNLWRADAVRRILLSPTHIGKIRDPDTGELIEGNWDGTIREDIWWAAQEILEHRAKRSNARTYLLTGYAGCGVCGSWTVAQGPRGRKNLSCAGVDETGAPDGRGSTHNLAIRMDWVDDYVIGYILRRMCDLDFIRSLTADAGEKRAAALAEARRLQAELEEMWAKVEAREPGYKFDRVAALEASWEPEIKRLEEEAAAGLSVGRALALEFARMVEDSGAEGQELLELLREAWDETPLGGRRELVRIYTKSITIYPRKQRGKKFDPTRVVIEPAAFA